ncbi:Mu transposase C-terminal domain-containing protein [bacterium RCC_150]
MKSVRLFDFIQFDGDAWQVVRQEGPTLFLKSLTTHRIRKIPAATLMESDSYLPDSPDRLPALDQEADIGRRSAQEQKKIAFIHRHIFEVLYGYSPDVEGNESPSPELRPEYDPSLPLYRRIDAKVRELKAAGTPMSESKLRRGISAYRKEGRPGLVDHRRSRLSTPTGRVHPDVVALVEIEMAEQKRRGRGKGPSLTRSTGTRSRVITLVTIEAAKQGLPIPSISTFYRLIGAMERHRRPFGDAKGRSSLASRPDRTFGHQDPVRPGELVEMDTTPLDVMAIHPDGSVAKPELAAVFDVASATLSSPIVQPSGLKAVDAVMLLARMLTPATMQPGWDDSLSLSRSILPEGMLMDDAQLRKQIAAHPLILPENVTIDRGKIFVSRTFLDAAERLGISIVKASPRTGSDKPHIERAFGAINTGFTQFLAGYTGRNVVQRGDLPEDEAIWTVAQIQDLLEQWLISGWQNRPVRGFRHPAMPRKDLTPNEMYSALVSVAPQVGIVLSRDDYIGLLPLDWRTINSYGINFHGLVYDSRELHSYRGAKSGLKTEPAKNRWEVRYDPYRLSSIFVRDHHKGVWMEAKWTMARQVLGPFSLDVLTVARKAVAKRDGRTPGQAVLAEINRIQSGGARTVQERKAAMRSAASQPFVPPAETQQVPTEEDPASTPEKRPSTRPTLHRIDEEED